MRTSRTIVLLSALVAILAADAALAQCVDVNQSTCSTFIIQNPVRTQCSNAIPDVVRLCPLGDMDVVTFSVIARDAAGSPCAGVAIKPVATGGTLNLATGGYTTAITNASGAASITVSAASGCGGLSVCWDDGSGTPIVFGCRVDARSPDVNKGATPALCGLSTSASCVTAPDITNPACGFLVGFGPVTPGVNGCWDMNCDNNVNAFDVNGTLSKGGLIQHFGHCGTLGTVELCP